MEDFLNEKVSQLTDGFSSEQIKDDIYRRLIKDHAGHLRLEPIIFKCMDFYAEVVRRYYGQNKCKHVRMRHPKEHAENKCALCDLPIRLDI